MRYDSSCWRTLPPPPNSSDNNQHNWNNNHTSHILWWHDKINAENPHSPLKNSQRAPAANDSRAPACRNSADGWFLRIFDEQTLRAALKFRRRVTGATVFTLSIERLKARNVAHARAVAETQQHQHHGRRNPNPVGLSPPRPPWREIKFFISLSGGWDLPGGIQQKAATKGSMLQSAWDAPKFQEISGNINFIDYPHLCRASVALQQRCGFVAFFFFVILILSFCSSS